MTAIGANPDSLDQLATVLSHAAADLVNSRQNVTNDLYQAIWMGADADNFRNLWDTTSSPNLSNLARVLDGLATTLRQNADAQRMTSQADAGLSTGIGSSPGGLSGQAPGVTSSNDDTGPFEDLIHLLADGFGELAFGTFATVVEHGGTVARLASVMQHVSGYTRGASVVDDYFRWAPGLADKLKPLLGNADDLAKGAKSLGEVLGWVGVGMGGLDQVFKDKGKFELDELTGRVIGRVGFEAFGAGLGTIATTAAIGAWGGPVGLGVGLAVGVAWWGVSEFTPVDDWIIEAGGWAGDRVGDAASAAADAASDLASGAADLASDTADAVDGVVDGVVDGAIGWLSPW